MLVSYFDGRAVGEGDCVEVLDGEFLGGAGVRGYEGLAVVGIHGASLEVLCWHIACGRGYESVARDAATTSREPHVGILLEEEVIPSPPEARRENVTLGNRSHGEGLEVGDSVVLQGDYEFRLLLVEKERLVEHGVSLGYGAEPM